MRIRTTSLAVALLAILAFAPVQAAESLDTVASLPSVEITTSVDKAEMYIGDLITYTVKITHDTSLTLLPFSIGANLGMFDVKDYQTDIESALPDGRQVNEAHFQLSTFTTGDYVIPPLPVVFDMPDGSRKLLMSESVPIRVLSLLDNAGDSLDIRDLKQQFAFERDYTWYYIGGGALLLLLIAAALLLWYLRKRGKPDAGLVDPREPWEIAFERLAMLKEQKYLEQDRYKEYYIELTELCREYLGRVYAINVLDMTTEEFGLAVLDKGLPDDLHTRLMSFFNHADLVKFAKLRPETERAEDDYIFVHETIESLRRVVIARREAEAQAAQTARPPAVGQEVR
jgi:hypothetical protein